ncbi:hypothetical protein ACFE04_030039 [Oxalis oulophora]
MAIVKMPQQEAKHLKIPLLPSITSIATQHLDVYAGYGSVLNPLRASIGGFFCHMGHQLDIGENAKHNTKPPPKCLPSLLGSRPRRGEQSQQAPKRYKVNQRYGGANCCEWRQCYYWSVEARASGKCPGGRAIAGQWRQRRVAGVVKAIGGSALGEGLEGCVSRGGRLDGVVGEGL